MSGLTVGLLSIDKLELEIKQKIGTDVEKKQVRFYFTNTYRLTFFFQYWNNTIGC